MSFLDEVNNAYNKGMKSRINDKVIDTIKEIANEGNKDKTPQVVEEILR